MRSSSTLATPSAIIWTRALRLAGLLVIACLVGAIGTIGSLSGVFFLRQDLIVGLAMLALFIVLHAMPAPPKHIRDTRINVPVLVGFGALVLIIGAYAGHMFILHGYDFSRDEQMATQDAVIFASGRFAVQVPDAWQTMITALNRTFNNSVLRADLTVSGYRPVNAMLHAVMHRLGAMSLTSPLMSAVGLIATWRVAERLWPVERNYQVYAIIFYLCSAQVWAASMTTYAMSALLAFNMVWLALFLRGGKLGYGLALVVGFAAVGLHQIPYHLLFVAPFLVLAVFQRRWFVAAAFGVVYGAAALFWLRYEFFVSFAMGGNALHATAGDISKIFGTATNSRPWAFTAANILRFFTWQHLLILPLVIVASRAALRDRHWLMIAMVAACAMPPAIKSLQIAYQGHGWGYRYEHGMIGLFCLLAAAGWIELQKQGLANPKHFKIATLATLCLSAPWLLRQASILSGLYANVDATISRVKADIVILDGAAAPFAEDIVINRPDVDNRPVRLAAAGLTVKDIEAVCRNGTIALMPGTSLDAINAAFGYRTQITAHFQAIANEVKKRCPDQVRSL